MKRLFLGAGIILAVTIFSIVGCQKENDIAIESNIDSKDKILSNESKINYGLHNILFKENYQDIKKLISNAEDRDDEKINNYLYELGLAMKDLIKYPDFNKIIIKMALESPANTANTANLIELANSYPKYKQTINNNLIKKGLQFDMISKNLTHYNGKYIENYIPCIFIPNLNNIDPLNQPILSPNIDVNSDNNEELEDNIFAWYLTENGDFKEIIIGEKEAMSTTNPLFLLDNGKEDIHINRLKTPKEINSKTTTAFDSYEFKLKYRYESTGKSEFCIAGSVIDDNGDNYYFLKKDNGTYTTWKLIDKVSKDDIGKNLSRWERFCDNLTPYSENYPFWNTFERDWNHSKKTLGEATKYGTTIYLYGNMKYESDWYAWTPSTIQIHYADLNYIYSHWAQWLNSWKADFRLWRVEL